jgi:hypothetical protein
MALAQSSCGLPDYVTRTKELKTTTKGTNVKGLGLGMGIAVVLLRSTTVGLLSGARLARGPRDNCASGYQSGIKG